MPLITCSCGRRIVTRPEWAGSRVRCPQCASAVPVPAEEVRVVGEPERAPRMMKSCRACAERIPVSAPQCPHCGESFGRFHPGVRPRQTDDGTAILVVAILGWALCGILHPVAWAMGSSRESQCRAQGIEPSGATKAGKILGIVGTILLGLALLLVAFAVAASAAR